MSSPVVPLHSSRGEATDQPYTLRDTTDRHATVVDLPRVCRALAELDAVRAEYPEIRTPDDAELAQLAELDPAYPVAHAFRVERNRGGQAKAAEKAHGGACFIVAVDCPLCGLQHSHGAHRAHGEAFSYTHRLAHCRGAHGAYYVRIDWLSVARAKPGKLWAKVRRKPRKGFTPWTPVDGGAQ